MGEAKVSSFEPEFNRSVKVEFADQRLLPALDLNGRGVLELGVRLGALKWG